MLSHHRLIDYSFSIYCKNTKSDTWASSTHQACSHALNNSLSIYLTEYSSRGRVRNSWSNNKGGFNAEHAEKLFLHTLKGLEKQMKTNKFCLC